MISEHGPAVNDCHDPYSPRRPGGANSVITDTAPPNSPPADSPWSTRRNVSSQGARAPACAYVGSAPISVVATVISVITRTSTGRRPIRSPRWPKSAAPTGRKKNASANAAYVFTSPSISLPPSGVKSRAAVIVAK